MSPLLVAMLAVTAQDSAALASPTQIDSAAEVTINARVDPDSITIGDRFTLTLIVDGVEDVVVVFPELPDTGDLMALAPPLERSDRAGDRRLAVYEMAAWKTGDFRLPAAHVTVGGAGTESGIPLPGVTIHVQSVLPADADPDTIAYRPARDVIGANWSRLEKLVGGALALAAILAVAFYVRRRNSASRIVAVPPPVPPKERALAALDLLGRSGLIESGEYKAFYSAVTHVLREYISDSYSAWSLDLTSTELFGVVRDDGMSDRDAEALRQLLIEADLVKFARRHTPRGRAAQALGATRRWVGDFIPPPESEPEPASEVDTDEHGLGAEVDEAPAEGNEDEELASLAEIFEGEETVAEGEMSGEVKEKDHDV